MKQGGHGVLYKKGMGGEERMEIRIKKRKTKRLERQEEEDEKGVGRRREGGRWQPGLLGDRRYSAIWIWFLRSPHESVSRSLVPVVGYRENGSNQAKLFTVVLL